MLTKKLIIQEFKALPGWSRGLEIRNGLVGQSQEIWTCFDLWTMFIIRRQVCHSSHREMAVTVNHPNENATPKPRGQECPIKTMFRYDVDQEPAFDQFPYMCVFQDVIYTYFLWLDFRIV